VQQHCDDMAAHIRSGINTVLEQRDLPGFAWGESSVFHVIVGQTCANRTAGDLRMPEGVPVASLKASGKAGLALPMTMAMALEGVDLFNGGGLLSVAHTAEDIDFTLAAFGRSLDRLEGAGYFA
jgi:glutamate-1-semialdehyde 2,1-aminomutase